MKKRRFTLTWLLLVVCALCLVPSFSFAQGFIVSKEYIIFPPRPFPIPRPWPIVPATPFCVNSLHVQTNITDALAETKVEQTFENTTSIAQEGVYLFPIPEGASISSFTLLSGGKAIEGKILGREEARAIYENIVRMRRDPALLEYVNHGMFRSSVFPIPANGKCTLTLKYVETLKLEGGTRKYLYPLSTGQFSNRPIKDSSVEVDLHTSSPLKTVFSPSHDISVKRTDDHHAVASWERQGDIPDRDFSLFYSVSSDNVGLSLITYKTPGKDGYFMLIASPGIPQSTEKPLPRQIVFVLDRTGSMESNHKIEQAKAALDYCLKNLGPTDKFGLLTFNESPDVFHHKLMSATGANVAEARKFVDRVDASGGTNIDDALRTAIKFFDPASDSQKMVVFLTDGLPTVGETNIETILSNIQKELPENEKQSGAPIRIFCFGVGYDVNAPFLDRLAEASRGDADYVRPEEQIESVVAPFFARVNAPALGNIQVAFQGEDVSDVYPRSLPDLFQGGQIILAGRYRGDNKGTITLTGSLAGRKISFQLPKAFSDQSASSSLIPRIWAMRKIGYLLDQVRLHEDKEVVDEIIRLSKDYGIITPYTSYLADDSQDTIVHPLVGGIGYEFLKDQVAAQEETARRGITELGTASPSGSASVYRSMNAGGYQKSAQAPTFRQSFGGAGAGNVSGFMQDNAAMEQLRRDRISVNYGDAIDNLQQLHQADPQASQLPGYQQIALISRVQSIGGRTFYRRNDIWFDNNYRSGEKIIQIKSLSEAHFQLLHALPALNQYAAVGNEVVVDLGNVAVQIGEKGKTSLSKDELRSIIR
jgi:Ca-activated chloride channel family protein